MNRKSNKKYPLIEHVFSVVEENSSIDDVLRILFNELLDYYHFDAIILKEFTNEDLLKCTYDISLNAENEFRDKEIQFVNEDILNNLLKHAAENITMLFRKDSDGNYVLYSDDCTEVSSERFTAKSIFFEEQEIACALDMPLILNDKILGFLEFVSFTDTDRIYKNEDINDFKAFIKLLVSYIFPIRELEKQKLKNEVSEQFDYVTKLPKYDTFIERVKQYKEENPNANLVIVDFDFSNFRYINEKYGYIEGNNILQMVASDIYKTVRHIVSASRTYADEFIIVSKFFDFNKTEDIETTFQDYVIHFSDSLQERFFDSNLIFNVGINILNAEDNDVSYAISKANMAKKFAKDLKPKYGLRMLKYNAGMSLKIRKQSEYINSISKAILDNDFFVLYQPKCNTKDMEICGAEALIRWKKDNMFVLAPDDFLYAFESNGSIIKLDYFVYNAVFAYLNIRKRRNLPSYPISLNVSIQHFGNMDLIDYFENLLRKYIIDPSLIELELAEQIFISENPNVMPIIQALKKLGFKIYIDNFGLGYSSLNVLTRYPIDGIKIDRSFMKQPLEQKDRIVLKCMINMATKLGMNVICEGVETAEQYNFMLESDCPYIQGFYFKEPVDEYTYSNLLDGFEE